MKGFVFSLESVLTARRFASDQAAGELALVTSERIRAEEEAGRLEKSLCDLEDELRELMRGVTDIGALAGGYNALRRQRDEWNASRAQVEEARRREGVAREQLLRRKREEEALVKLRRRKQAEYIKEAERQEALSVDDFINSVHRGRLTEKGQYDERYS